VLGPGNNNAITMPFVFGNDYGNLYGNLLATQQQDAQNYSRLAEINRQDQGDQWNHALALLSLQNQARQQAQSQAAFDFQRQNALAELALRQRGENRLESAQAEAARHNFENEDLQNQQFDWRMTQPSASDEKANELLFKNALELADTGELTPEVSAGLPSTQKTFLEAHNERARKAMLGQKSDLEQAAETLNRQTQLEYYIKQAQESPGVFFTGRRERTKENLQNWKDELEQLQKATSAIRPETRAHLRLNEQGWWEPSIRLPWQTQTPLTPPAPVPGTNNFNFAQPTAATLAAPQGVRTVLRWNPQTNDFE